jgi:hypothetical protein
VENEVVIHVRSEDDTAKGFDSARKNAKKLGEDVERGLKQSGQKGGCGLADGIGDGLSKGQPAIVNRADRIGVGVIDEMETAGDRAGGKLGSGIVAGLAESAPLISGMTERIGDDVEDEMETAGDKAGSKLGDGIKRGLAGASGDDGEKGIFSKMLPALTKGAKGAGKATAETFAEAFGQAAQAAGTSPYVIAGIAGLTVVASPLIGGVLAAAVIGAGGGLGIAGGFAAAASDPRVKGAAKALGEIVKSDLQSAAKSFVPAATDAIERVGGAFKSLLPTVASIFGKSAGLLDPLINGILDGVSTMMDGIDQMLGGAGPVFESFGDMFEEVGEAIGDMFAHMADDGDSAAAALDFFTGMIVTTIQALTIFMEVAASVIDTIRPAGGLIADWANALVAWTDGADTAIIAGAEWHDVTIDAASAAEAQNAALKELEETMRQQTDPLYAMISAQQAVREAQGDYNKALDKHGPKSKEARDALIKLGSAASNLTSKAGQAAREGLDGKLTPAMRTAMRNAGLTKKEIDALEKELISAKRAADRWEGTFTQTYHVVRKENVSYAGNSVTGGKASGGIVGAATGGMHSGMRMVGEAGPELVDLPAGTQVHSNPDTQRMMSGAAGSSLAGGKLEIVLKFDPSHAPEAIRGMMEGIRAEVRGDGGSVQASLGVAGVA